MVSYFYNFFPIYILCCLIFHLKKFYYFTRTVMEIADYIRTQRDPFETRTGLEVLEDLHYILKEVHERRYLICMQVGKDLIEEYLSHATWCYQLKCEKIAKYDFVSVFKRLFGNNFFAENPMDENRLQQ